MNRGGDDRELPTEGDPEDVFVGEFVVSPYLLAVVFRGGSSYSGELEALAKATP